LKNRKKARSGTLLFAPFATKPLNVAVVLSEKAVVLALSGCENT